VRNSQPSSRVLISHLPTSKLPSRHIYHSMIPFLLHVCIPPLPAAEIRFSSLLSPLLPKEMIAPLRLPSFRTVRYLKVWRDIFLREEREPAVAPFSFRPVPVRRATVGIDGYIGWHLKDWTSRVCELLPWAWRWSSSNYAISYCVILPCSVL